jgi:hypothetical protein
VRIALIDLFAGRRATSRSLELLDIAGDGTRAVECNPYLNTGSAAHWPKKVVILDIDHIDESLSRDFLGDLQSFEIVLIVGIRGPGKRNKLSNHLPRILKRVEKAVETHSMPASRRYPGGLGALVIDSKGEFNAFAATIRKDFRPSGSLDDPAIKEISKELGVKPLRISALPVSATVRRTLYWCDSDWLAETGEKVRQRPPSSPSSISAKPSTGKPRRPSRRASTRVPDFLRGRTTLIARRLNPLADVEVELPLRPVGGQTGLVNPTRQFPSQDREEQPRVLREQAHQDAGGHAQISPAAEAMAHSPPQPATGLPSGHSPRLRRRPYKL